MNRLTLIILQNCIGFFILINTTIGVLAQNSTPHQILILGDSISAGYGLPSGTSWVNLLQDTLKKDQSKYSIVNSSISGETSAGGKTRISSLIQQHKPHIVIVELGANDALRGFPLATTYQNLQEIILISKNNGAKVLILGMKIPTNYGAEYTAQFSKMYVDLGKNTQSSLVPFFFEGIATKREYFQEDGIHPNQNAQAILLKNVLPTLKKLL
jgi:acyl-CoA thioesterase-1